MADLITDIVDPQAFEQVKNLNAEMKLLVDQFEKSAKATIMLQNQLGNAKGVKNQTQAVSELDKVLNQNKVLVEKLSIADTQAKKTNLELAASLNEVTKASKLRVKEMQSEGAYGDGLRAKINSLTTAYYKLTEAQVNSQIGQKMKADISIAKKSLDEFQQGIGNFSGNVGNYTNSIQSAFGKVWSGLRTAANIIPGLGLSGMFLAMYQGAVLLYDKMVGTNKELEKTNEIRKKLNETMNTALEAGGKEITNLESLYKRATDVNISYSDRLKAVKDLQDQYPHYFGNLREEVIMAGKAKDAYLDLNNELVKSVIYRGFQSMADEIAKDLPKLLLMQDIISKKLAESYSKKRGPDDYSTEGTIRDQAQRKELLDTLKAIPGIGEELSSTMEKEGFTLQQMLTKINGMVDDSQSKMRQVLAAGEDYASTLIAGKDKKDPKLKEQIKKKVEEFKAEFKKQIESINDETTVGPKISQATIKALGEAYQGMYDQILKDIDSEYPAEMGDADAKWLNYTLLTRKSKAQQLKDSEELAKKEEELHKQKMKTANDYNQLIQDTTQTLSAISDIAFMKDMERLDARDKALQEYYDNELRFIEQSGMSSAKKEKEKQKLEAETAAKRKQIEHDRVTAQRRAAATQKALDIVSLIGSTTIAVMAALGTKPYTPLNIALAAGAGATGAAQIAKLVATPLPAYKHGTKNHKGGLFIGGDGGERELVVEPSGKAYLTSDTASIYSGPSGTKVYNSEQMLSELNNAAMVKLSKEKTVTTDKLQAALLEKFDENTSEIVVLQDILKHKRMGTNNADMSVYRNYIETKIR